MSLPSKVNKENFRLLDLSSDEESEDLQLEIIPSRKKKVTRRDRSRGISPKTQEVNIGAEVQCAVRWALRGTLLLWLLMLTWICATLYDQVSSMKMQMDSVTTTNQGVGDALQIYHTAAKELRANATELNERLSKLEHEHQELAKKVEQAIKKLMSVSDQLDAAPEISKTPKLVGELQITIADLGSQMRGFDSAIATARKQAATATSGLEEVKTLLQQLEARTNETIASVLANTKRENEIELQVQAVNNTLDTKLETLRTRVEVMKPETTPAPSTTTVTTPSNTSSSTTSSTTTTPPPPPPGPPAKPNVLQ
ncbi:nuclear distribution protein nudE homolog 1-like isoform X2 [Hyposmocoma kahamanoa]|uniref:nuclear distribution protein nudE homolog 1-like isoform X2 n=1 Tax=Hyposmocoma kahamanoa TaxID=1477025 RepID=UPI000E6D7375|nr:nuclear distribution protein nudE homolog 1-like isoform X2 [Hyposmocoma kahamanoa]